MRITTYFLPFDDPSAADPLNQRLASARVIHIDRHLVDRAHACGWSIVVTHEAPRGASTAALPAAPPAPQSSAAAPTPRRDRSTPPFSEVDYRAVLPPEQFAQFSILRQLRKDIAQRDSVPPYSLFNNQQLATMVNSGVRMSLDDGRGGGAKSARGVSRLWETGLLMVSPPPPLWGTSPTGGGGWSRVAAGGPSGPCLRSGCEAADCHNRLAFPFRPFCRIHFHQQLCYPFSPTGGGEWARVAARGLFGPVWRPERDGFRISHRYFSLIDVSNRPPQSSPNGGQRPEGDPSQSHSFLATTRPFLPQSSPTRGRVSRRPQWDYLQGGHCPLTTRPSHPQSSPTGGGGGRRPEGDHVQSHTRPRKTGPATPSPNPQDSASILNGAVRPCSSKEAARDSLAAVELWVARERHLSLKVSPQIGRSRAGLPFLGFVVTPGRLGLLCRRRRRFRAALARWESAFVSGRINAAQLQAGVQAALAISHHADANAFRKGLLARRAVLDV